MTSFLSVWDLRAVRPSSHTNAAGRGGARHTPTNHQVNNMAAAAGPPPPPNEASPTSPGAPVPVSKNGNQGDLGILCKVADTNPAPLHYVSSGGDS